MFPRTWPVDREQRARIIGEWLQTRLAFWSRNHPARRFSPPSSAAAFRFTGSFTDASFKGPTLPAMFTKFREFLVDKSGATAIEYALIAAGIAVVIITAVKGIGTKLNARFLDLDAVEMDRTPRPQP